MTQGTDFTKRCSGCKKLLPAFRFSKSKSRRDGLQHECKACQAKREKARARRSWTNEAVAERKARAEEQRNVPKLTSAEKQRVWREANPEKHKMGRKRYYAKKYGLTVEELDAKLAEQDGQCAICKVDIEVATGNGMHIDHDHYNGKLRALLCGPCNSGLGLFADDPIKLHRAAGYIEFWQVIHESQEAESRVE